MHHRISEERLVRRGLSNYWGYNTLGFFAPDARFATGDRGQQVHEFKAMVKALHRAGIEVLLDVVYNHTAEGDHTGPTLSLARHRQRRLLPARTPSARASTSTSRAAATRSTFRIRARSSS